MLRLYDMVFHEWDRLKSALYEIERVSELCADEISRRYLLDRTLNRWDRLLTSDVSDKNVLFVDRALDDLKDKLENRVKTGSTVLKDYVETAIDIAEQLEIAIENAVEVRKIQEKIEEFKARFPAMASEVRVGDLYVFPYGLHRIQWERSRRIIDRLDPSLAEELNYDIRPFLI